MSKLIEWLLSIITVTVNRIDGQTTNNRFQHSLSLQSGMIHQIDWRNLIGSTQRPRTLQFQILPPKDEGN